MKIPDIFIENLIFKWFLAKGSIIGQQLAYYLGIPFNLVDEKLYSLKKRMLLHIQGSTGIQDFNYELTDEGKEKALAAREASNYLGPIPVHIDIYTETIDIQSVRNGAPSEESLKEAFSDILIPPDLLDVLGQLLLQGRGCFYLVNLGTEKPRLLREFHVRMHQPSIFPRSYLLMGKLFNCMIRNVMNLLKVRMLLLWICDGFILSAQPLLSAESLNLSPLTFSIPILGISEAPPLKV